MMAAPLARPTRTRACTVYARHLSALGIDYHARTWHLPNDLNMPSDQSEVIDWNSFLAPFSTIRTATSDIQLVLRTLAALWITGQSHNGRGLKPITLKRRLVLIRGFVLDMARSGHESLQSVSPAEAQSWIRQRYWKGKYEPATKSTVRAAIATIRELHLLQADLGMGLVLDPVPRKAEKRLLIKARSNKTWEAPPKNVCEVLLRTALRLLQEPAEDVIRLVDKYAGAIESARQQGITQKRVLGRYGQQALLGECFSAISGESEPWTDVNPRSPGDVALLVRRIQDACFIAITYTTGARVSEVRRAGPTSLRHLTHRSGAVYPYYFAPRSKVRERAESTKVMRDDVKESPWILSPAAYRALDVLERLSAPLRARSKVENFWVTFSGSGLWPRKEPKRKFHILTGSNFNDRLNRFAAFVDIEGQTGWAGRLHSHMGRKCLARFVALRDRSALGDLAIQYAHTSGAVTDEGYGRPDNEFRRLVDEEIAKELAGAAVDLANLAPSEIFHKMDNATFQKWVSPLIGFRGKLMPGPELRKLFAKGASLVPGLWGACIYRQATSACKGDRSGPNAALRSPLTCAGCTNFLATASHAEWWDLYRDDCIRHLRISDMPIQTVLILRQRIKQADEILACISKRTGKDSIHV